eukprot:1178330-Prorocentrum_minimum.AAC.2
MLEATQSRTSFSSEALNVRSHPKQDQLLQFKGGNASLRHHSLAKSEVLHSHTDRTVLSGGVGCGDVVLWCCGDVVMWCCGDVELTKELREAEQQWMDESEKGALIAAEAAVAALLKSDSPGLSEVDDHPLYSADGACAGPLIAVPPPLKDSPHVRGSSASSSVCVSWPWSCRFTLLDCQPCQAHTVELVLFWYAQAGHRAVQQLRKKFKVAEVSINEYTVDEEQEESAKK